MRVAVLVFRDILTAIPSRSRTAVVLAGPVKPQPAAMSGKKILFVLTSHDKIDKINQPTGWYSVEAIHPFYILQKAGYTIDWATPKGGEAPLDPSSIEMFKDDPEQQQFLKEESAWKSTKPLASVKASDYAAVFYPGGHGPVYDLAGDKTSQDLIKEFYESGRPTASVCHGPAVFLNVVLSDGAHLIKGRKITCFTNAEEDEVKLSDALPYLVETRLKEGGAEFSSASQNWGEHCLVDKNLMTGQNPASASAVAKAMLGALNL